MRRLFERPNRLIAGRIALFMALVVGLRIAQYYAFTRHLPEGALATPLGLLSEEAIRVAIVLLATLILARLEAQSIATYGLGGAHPGRLLLEGSLWGLATIKIVTGLQCAAGNLELFIVQDSLARHLLNGLLWLLCFYAVAFFEELLLRGYLQYALARGIGFWWAALIWSAVFVWMHTTNDNESPLGLAQTGLAALFFCLALRLTGSLWWVIGYHALWDWGESYFFGVRTAVSCLAVD